MEPVIQRCVEPYGLWSGVCFRRKHRFAAILSGFILVFAVAVTLPRTGYSHSPDAPSVDQRAKTVHLSLQACLEMPDSYEKTICLEPHFRSLTREVSARDAMRLAKQMKKGGKIDDCHLIAHFIGDETMRKHSFDTGRALASCSLDCIQGCIHGAMQTFVSEKIDTTDIAAALKHVCDSVADDRLLRRQCIHGVGHGFLTGGFLPLEEAIDACHHFQGREAVTCLDGLSMEIMQASLLVSEEELKADLPNICAEAIAVGKDQFDIRCFISIGEGLMFFTGHDLEKSTRLCRLLPAERQPACMIGVVGEAENAARSDR